MRSQIQHLSMPELKAYLFQKDPQLKPEKQKKKNTVTTSTNYKLFLLNNVSYAIVYSWPHLV